MTGAAAAAIERLYRSERRRVLATLIRLLGSFDAAEDALHDAFAAAAVSWPRDGVPRNPYAWLVSTGRFRTIDRWRRRARLAAALPELARLAETEAEVEEPHQIRDDELRLIFTCCHPALAPDAQIALTLREVGGLTTEEIARAYLTRPATIAQRIVRAKARIRDEAIPYVVPERSELRERVAAVLRVLYLIFNEGYSATGGPHLTRADLCAEALRLAREVNTLLEESEGLGLLALMLLHEARREARTGAGGDIVLLQDQDRSLWKPGRIAEARDLIDRAFATGSVGPYLLQAAIAGVHSAAPRFEETDWSEIAALYDILLRIEPSPVVALNRAIAIGMRDGPTAGLALIEALTEGSLASYPAAHAARADFLARLGRSAEARGAYERAALLTRQPAEKRFFAARILEV